MAVLTSGGADDKRKAFVLTARDATVLPTAAQPKGQTHGACGAVRTVAAVVRQSRYVRGLGRARGDL
jgi:hypothetical protein